MNILPGTIIFGVGPALAVAPVTATVVAGADPRHAEIAARVDNAVARVAALLAAVAILPADAGLRSDRFYRAAPMTTGFHTAMLMAADWPGPVRRSHG